MKYLFMLILLGCSPKMGLITKNFESTNSPCIDGVFVNMEYHGCVGATVIQVPGKMIHRVQCVNKVVDNGWTKNVFYVVPHEVREYQNDWFIICRDPIVDIYFTKLSYTPDAPESDNRDGNKKPQ